MNPSNDNHQGFQNVFRFQCEIQKMQPSYEVAYLKQIIDGVAREQAACNYCGTVWCHCGGDRAKS